MVLKTSDNGYRCLNCENACGESLVCSAPDCVSLAAECASWLGGEDETTSTAVARPEFQETSSALLTNSDNAFAAQTEMQSSGPSAARNFKGRPNNSYRPANSICQGLGGVSPWACASSYDQGTRLDHPAGLKLDYPGTVNPFADLHGLSALPEPELPSASYAETEDSLSTGNPTGDPAAPPVLNFRQSEQVEEQREETKENENKEDRDDQANTPQPQPDRELPSWWFCKGPRRSNMFHALGFCMWCHRENPELKYKGCPTCRAERAAARRANKAKAGKDT